MNYENELNLIDDFEKSVENSFINLDNNIEENTFLNNFSEQNKKLFSDFIFSLVEDFYNNSILSNNKPKEGELNIFSSLILQNNKDYKIITFSSGTKSLGNKSYQDNKEYKIKDCHAEILTFRSFKLFLIKCLKFNYLVKFSDCNKILNEEKFIQHKVDKFLTYEEFVSFNTNRKFFEIFEFYKNSKIFLKDFIYFHLYISEIPCGDSSIYPINLNDIKLSEETEKKEIIYNQTGSKVIENLDIEKNENKYIFVHDNSLGKFRSKSMRSDIKKENITFSLSCSDKILFRNIFGIQGKFLYKIIHPIYISSIILSVKENLLVNNETNIKIIESIRRGISLIRREDSNKIFKNGIFKNIKIKKFGFNFNEPKIFLTEKNLFVKKNNNINLNEKYSQSFSIFWYFTKSDFSKIDPNSGFKQGTVVNSNKFNFEKSKLEICKIEIFYNFLQFLSLYTHNDYDIGIVNNNEDNILENQKEKKFIENFSNLKLNKLIILINSDIDEIKNEMVLQGNGHKNLDKSVMYSRILKSVKKTSGYNYIKEILFKLFEIDKFLK